MLAKKAAKRQLLKVANFVSLRIVAGGMYYFLSLGFIGMTYFTLKDRKNPHISSEKCPKRKSRVKSPHPPSLQPSHASPHTFSAPPTALAPPCSSHHRS